ARQTATELRRSGTATVPSNRRRSRTPSRSARGTRGTGGGMRRLYRSSFRPSRISMTSRWPSVVRRPTRAPFRSRSALVATVVPGTIRSVSLRRPLRSRSSSSARSPSPSMTPTDGSAGVEADLARTTRPASSTATRSVKVPPTSTPIRYTSAPLPAAGNRATLGPGRRHRAGPAVPARATGHELVLHVVGPRGGRPLPRVAVAATPARLHQEHVARAHEDAHLLGLERPVGSAPGAEAVAVGEPVLPPEDPVGRVADAVPGGVGERGLRDLGVELEDGAEAAAVLPVPARAGPELVAREEQREAHLRHLDAPELDPARRLPFPRGRPAVTGGRGPAPGPRVE